MRFALHVLGCPIDSACARTALYFTRALLAQGHTVYRVFFQGAGVHVASAFMMAPPDELNVAEAWAALGRAHKLDLAVCVTSATRRGILDNAEARRCGLGSGNLRPEFAISGLGQLVDATLKADRVVTFAP